MGRWLERRENWLRNENNLGGINFRKKGAGRPQDTSNDYAVRFIPLRCPRCKSKNIKCYASRLPIRYHICQKCGHNFKSIEAGEEK